MNKLSLSYQRITLITSFALLFFACGQKTEKTTALAEVTQKPQEIIEKPPAEAKPTSHEVIEQSAPLVVNEEVVIEKASKLQLKEKPASNTATVSTDTDQVEETDTVTETEVEAEEIETEEETQPEEASIEEVEESESEVEPETETEIPTKSLPDHSAWDILTKTFVTASGNVNYDGFLSKKADITAYIEQLKNLPPQKDWEENETLAYWINLYNALTVDLILKHYPLKSIMDINKGKAWDLMVITIGDKSYSLNNIEHDVIRKEFKEPRIHFAVNCAATSCPKLLNGAFLPAQLDKQLESQAIYFINNTGKNRINSKQTELSRIFDWYGSDFGDIKAYIARYHKDFNADASIQFLEYDWRLNK